VSKSNIEWTEQTWNPIVGCSIVSPGCTNCYAMKTAARNEAMGISRYDGTTRVVNGNVVWTGKLAQAPESTLLQPLKRKKPTTYFVNSMGDLFHEDVPDAWIDRIFAVMSLTPQHTYQVLTKRAGRMRDYLADFLSVMDTRPEFWKAWAEFGGTFDQIPAAPLPNVWLGVSTERQQEADERIPLLLQTPAAVRFISAEPLLGPIDLTSLTYPKSCECENHGPMLNAFEASVMCEGCCEDPERMDLGILNWVIAGGESGTGARSMHPDWARSLRDQCMAASVPFFFKQWGVWAPYDRSKTDGAGLATPFSLDMPMGKFGKNLSGRLLDGVTHDEMPGARR